MKTLSISEAKKDIGQTFSEDEPLLITQSGSPAYMIFPIADNPVLHEDYELPEAHRVSIKRGIADSKRGRTVSFDKDFVAEFLRIKA